MFKKIKDNNIFKHLVECLVSIKSTFIKDKVIEKINKSLAYNNS